MKISYKSYENNIFVFYFFIIIYCSYKYKFSYEWCLKNRFQDFPIFFRCNGIYILVTGAY